MYDFRRTPIKVVVVGLTFIGAAYISIRIWKADFDIRQLINPKRVAGRGSTPQRELDAIYQDGHLVARVGAAVVDAKAASVTFGEIYNSSFLNLSREFEYQKWRLKFRGADSITLLLESAPEKGRIIAKAVCEITGERAP